MPTEPTWKNTLHPHRHFGHISKFMATVKDSGYPYYEWNGWIYATSGGQMGVRVCEASALDAQLRVSVPHPRPPDSASEPTALGGAQ